jgi:hypothetical protein
MKIDTVITLANNKNYLLLLEDDFMDEDYFLAVLLDENNEPTKTYAVLKEIKKQGEVYIQKVTNPEILSQLLNDFNVVLISLNTITFEMFFSFVEGIYMHKFSVNIGFATKKSLNLNFSIVQQYLNIFQFLKE